MGKPIKHSDMVKQIGNHYEVVEFVITYKEASAGGNCAIMVNGTQACAGVKYIKKDKAAQPSKDECTRVAEQAHKVAMGVYNSDHPEKKIPKKLTGEAIRGS